MALTSFFLILSVGLITNAVDLTSAVKSNAFGARFDITGTLIQSRPVGSINITIADSSGRTIINDLEANLPIRRSAGDVIRAKGFITKNWLGLTTATSCSVDIVGHEPPQPPQIATIAELNDGQHDFQVIQTTGTIREVFRDEIDPTWVYVSLSAGSSQIYVVFAARQPKDGDSLMALADAKVSVTGVCQETDDGLRRKIGRTVQVADLSDIKVLHPAPSDPFAFPPLTPDSIKGPADTLALGKRRITGLTIAVLGDGDILLQDPSGDVHSVRFANRRPPAYGSSVEIVGLPETDLYRINFSNAIWRPCASSTNGTQTAATTVSVTDILANLETGLPRIDPRFHGKPIRIVGTIMDMPLKDSGQGIVTLRSENFTIPVDISTNRPVLDEIAIGCTVSVSGTCVVETENWRPYAAFPHTTGITLVVRTPEDVVILSHPSWWTPQRLMIVVGILLIVIIIVFIWNRILQRIIDKKSRLLLKEQVAQIKSELRVDERTHLAVELHDTLSQNLSGVACQIAATKGTLPEGADETARYLETAERMLLSCRTELRRCLWDLRGDTLEEANFTEAIRKTLAPVAIGVETIIRFNVPRSRLSDTTAHAVLCIIRELVANAIRHGKAKAVRIAGEFHDGVLSFSVRDDGRGFDPSNCNGPAEGHFGLEGIRERIKHLDGIFSITSEIGKGTRAEVTLSSSQPNNEEAET